MLKTTAFTHALPDKGSIKKDYIERLNLRTNTPLQTRILYINQYVKE